MTESSPHFAPSSRLEYFVYLNHAFIQSWLRRCSFFSAPHVRIHSTSPWKDSVVTHFWNYFLKGHINSLVTKKKKRVLEFFSDSWELLCIKTNQNDLILCKTTVLSHSALNSTADNDQDLLQRGSGKQSTAFGTITTHLALNTFYRSVSNLYKNACIHTYTHIHIYIRTHTRARKYIHITNVPDKQCHRCSHQQSVT